MRGRIIIPNCVIAAGLCFSFLMPVSAANAAEPVSAMLAAEIVAPGETLEFMQADGGARECRVKDLIIGEIPVIGCGRTTSVWRGTIPIEVSLDPFIATGFNAARREAEAAFSNILISAVPSLVPHYATGAVYNDFQIDDPFGAGNIVDVQFAIKYSWSGLIGGSLFYEGRITVSVEIEDITSGPNNPIGIASFDLANRDRQGDQGVTDIAAGVASYDRNNDTAGFSLKLRSGGTYRIWFKAEAYGFPIAVNVESSVRGSWSELSVTVVQDDTELLFQLQDDLVQHDMDIKAQLAKQQAQLRKIIYLLKDDDDDDDDRRRRRRK